MESACQCFSDEKGYLNLLVVTPQHDRRADYVPGEDDQQADPSRVPRLQETIDREDGREENGSDDSCPQEPALGTFGLF
jgi:hypothetical protein